MTRLRVLLGLVWAIASAPAEASDPLAQAEADAEVIARRAAMGEDCATLVEKVNLLRSQSPGSWRIAVVAGEVLSCSGRLPEAVEAYEDAVRMGGSASELTPVIEALRVRIEGPEEPPVEVAPAVRRGSRVNGPGPSVIAAGGVAAAGVAALVAGQVMRSGARRTLSAGQEPSMGDAALIGWVNGLTVGGLVAIGVGGTVGVVGLVGQDGAVWTAVRWRR